MDRYKERLATTHMYRCWCVKVNPGSKLCYYLTRITGGGFAGIYIWDGLPERCLSKDGDRVVFSTVWGSSQVNI